MSLFTVSNMRKAAWGIGTIALFAGAITAVGKEILDFSDALATIEGDFLE